MPLALDIDILSLKNIKEAMIVHDNNYIRDDT